MKFTIDSSEFSKALERAAKFISAKPLMPILANLELIANKDCGLDITGFNLAHGIQINVECDVIDCGSVCIPQSAVDIIKLMPGRLIIEADENHSITISNLGGNAQIQGQSIEEYPELIEDGDDPEVAGTSIELDASSFSLLLKTCGQSTSGDETKQILTGINIGASKGKLTAIATNGHRLTVLNLLVDDNISIAPITVPSKSLNLIDAGKSDKVEITSAKSQVSIGCSDSRSIMRVIDGKYPDALMLLPKAFARTLTLDRKKLIDCLNVMNAISDKNNLVEFHVLEKSLSIYSKSDGKTGEQKMTCVLVDPNRLESEEFAIAFNLKYLTEGLKMFDTTSVVINMNTPTEPVVIQAVDSDVDLIYLIMPIQIRE
jgi:DNA polymerase III subunit beta